VKLAPNPKSKILYLIDGSSYIYRAYHAVRHLSTTRGLPTNATFGFTNMLLKLFSDRKPEHMAMAFDAKGPTFRHEIYEAYKANRPPMPEDLAVQIPYIKEVVEGMNIPSLELAGYEADDIIGTLPVLYRKRASTWSWSRATRTSNSWFPPKPASGIP